MSLESLLSSFDEIKAEKQQRVILLAGITAIFRNEKEWKTADEVLKRLGSIVLMAGAESSVNDYPEVKTVLSVLESKAIDEIELDPSTPKNSLIKKLREGVDKMEKEIENEEDVKTTQFTGPMGEA